MSFKYLDPTGVGYFWYKIKSLVSTKYTKPDTGIPKSDLESSVQTTLINADTVVTNFSNKIDKVNGATAGNIAILNATGSITDGNTSIQNVELNVDTNGHTYVDLGLPSGTLWATCNVGATNPEDYGDYYAWGETQTKQEYSWNTYQHGSSNSNITKYNVTDGKTELEPDDDVCHIVMGGDWRMPTEVQCRELIANTTYIWTTTNGITGILLTSTINNNTLFIPASGYINNTSTTDLTVQSCIWSSNLYIHETYGIMGVSELNYRETGSLITVSNDRYKGYPCRGVINKSGIEFKQGKTIMPVKTTASAVEFPDGETALSKVSNLEENKVDKVSGKSLSTNDYTTEDKTKLSNIASGAQVNVLETVKVNDNPLTITNKSVNIDLSNYAQKDGSYSGMTVGAAEDLVSAESVASEFTSRITGGSTAVGKGGTALLDKIKGRTLVWNQLNGFSSYSGDRTNINNVSWTKVGTRITVVIGSGGATNGFNIDLEAQANWFVPNHRYLFKCKADFALSASTVRYGYSSLEWFSTESAIRQWTTGGNSGIFGLRVDNGAEAGTYTIDAPQIFDLTLMFGAGNEPSTVAQFEALYPLPSYGYNPGELINNGHQSDYDLTWNQLCQTNWFPSTTLNDVTLTNNGDGSYTINGTSNAGSVFYAYTSRTSWGNHKYYISVTDADIGLYFNGNTKNSGLVQKHTQIIAADASVVYMPAMFIESGKSFSNKKIYIRIHDLTLMFGAGNEPATVAEFEAMFPADYYPYDTGTEQHFSFPQFKTKIETVGWNQFDKDITVESLSVDGSGGSSTFRYVKRFKALAGSYFFNYVNNSNVFVKTVINGTYGGALGVNTSGGTTFTMSAPGEIWVYSSQAADLNSVSDQLCISLSDPSRNGTYEPYWRSELELGLGDIKVKSHNIWDEEWEAGNINSTAGENVNSTTLIRSVNYIKVEPGKTYYAETTGDFYYRFYDNNKNYIPFSSSFVQDKNRARTVFIMPEGVGYIRFIHTGTTYTNDICLNLSDPAFNGRYEPYGDGGVISITGGLKSAGVAYDEISGGKLLKRIESVDMGSMTWGADTYREHTRFFSALADSKTDSSVYQLNNQINSYGYISTPKVVADNTVNLGLSKYNNDIYIRNDAYEGNNGSVFKAAMTGVLLYYELDQPIEYELAEAIPTAMRNDPYGTERRLPEDTAAIVTAPFRADITYSTNIKEAVQSLPQNYINVNSMQDFLAALGAQMGGTWTMRPADGKFDFSFTPNPIEPVL